MEPSNAPLTYSTRKSNLTIIIIWQKICMMEYWIVLRVSDIPIRRKELAAV